MLINDMRTLCIILFLLVSYLFSHAQQGIRLCVCDETNVPLDAASVVVSDEGKGRVVKTGVTDADGCISMELTEGSYQCYVSMLGYKPKTQKLSIPSGENHIRIVLEIEPAQLADVVVTARKQRPLAKMEDGKVTINVSQSYLSTLGNGMDVLKHTPGIKVSHKGDIALTALGGTAVYINGKKINLQGEALVARLRSISADKIEKITTSANPDARYDSEGAGGIIDIILKEKIGEGFFLTTSHGISYWNNMGETSDLSLSYNRRTWKIGLNYNHDIGSNGMNYGSERILRGNRSVLETEDNDDRDTYAGGIDFVWQPDKRHKLSLTTSVDALIGPGTTETETQEFTGLDDLTNVYQTLNDYQKQRNVKYGGGINYLFTPNERHRLSLSADLIYMDGVSECDLPHTINNVKNNTLTEQNYFSTTRRDIDIFSLMADYQLTFDKHHELMTGIKVSGVKSDNDYVFVKDGVTDDSRSNHFVYQEDNVEGYAQYTWQRKKWMATAGMRLELMSTDGLLRYRVSGNVVDEHNRKKRVGLFPNVSLTYQMTENSKLTLSYSKRQDKPKYEDLNPFEYFLDPLTSWKGNPFIAPQKGHKVQLNFATRGLGVTLSFNQLNDYFTSLVDEGPNNSVVTTTKNIGRQQQAALELIYNRRLASWWDFNAQVGGYYFINRLDYESYREAYRRASYSLSLNHNISLPAKIGLEIAMRYHSKRQGGSYDVLKSTGSIDAGLNRSFLKDRLNISFLITDILHTERWDGYGRKAQFNIQSWGYSESRLLYFKVSYQLGVTKMKAEKAEVKEAERL